MLIIDNTKKIVRQIYHRDWVLLCNREHKNVKTSDKSIVTSFPSPKRKTEDYPHTGIFYNPSFYPHSTHRPHSVIAGMDQIIDDSIWSKCHLMAERRG